MGRKKTAHEAAETPIPARQTVSVAMIARNEEANLPRTLAALDWVDEVVIVDSGSIDQTPAIAAAHGARFTFNRDFRGHSEQKNVAINLCRCDWILLLDADEVVTPELRDELLRVLARPEKEAYWIPRLNIFITRWMYHGGLYPDRKLRLFRRGAAWVEEGAGPHGTPLYEKDRGVLSNHLLHFGYPDFAGYLEHMNQYSTDTVPPMLGKRGHASAASMLLRAFLNPLFGFLKNYLLRGGFRDGPEGLIFHLNHAVYVHWKYVKVWERLVKQGRRAE